MRTLATATAAIIWVCGCTGPASVPAGPQSGARTAGNAPLAAAGTTGKRLFVSDAGTGNVFLYDVPSLKLVTILQGFTRPQGLCADDKGNVWIADGEAALIYKVTYQGRVENKLSDTTGYPNGCAWDPKTGNVAVMNFIGTQSKPGDVLIYHHGSGNPNTYANPSQYYYDFGGYDSSGNLLFDGSNAQGKFMLSKLAVNASSARTVAISGGTVYAPGMVQWNSGSSDLDVGDQNCGDAATSCIYQMTVSGTHATIKGKTTLETYAGTQVCDIVQGVVSGSELFGSDNDYCGYAQSATYGWSYPSGGAPKDANKKNASAPFGAAIAVQPMPEASGDGRAQAPWMDLAAKKLDLLYIANGSGEVSVYTYWQKTLVGELTGFNEPEGECVDKNNDVYVTDAGKDAIVEYAHADKKPLRTIDESPNVPYGCAVDFTTGNLAIANQSGGSGGQGNIAVYADASGTPTIYTDASIGTFTACVYDNKGNLLATNGGGQGLSYFAWLPKGGDKVVNISIPGSPYGEWEDVQGLQWDGRYFVIDLYNLYRVAIQSGLAYYVGRTDISESDVWGPYWIYNNNPNKQGTQFVGAYHSRSYPLIYYFNYPAGGDQIGYLSKGVSSPNGLTVSLGKIHG